MSVLTLVRGTLMLVTLAAGQGALPAPAAEVQWKKSVGEAWQDTKEQSRPLLMFFTMDGCKYCTKMKQTYADTGVAERINASFIAVVVNARGAPQLSKNYKVTAFPTTIIISPQAQVLGRVKGYVPPDRFAAELSKAVERASSVSHRARRTRAR